MRSHCNAAGKSKSQAKSLLQKEAERELLGSISPAPPHPQTRAVPGHRAGGRTAVSSPPTSGAMGPLQGRLRPVGPLQGGWVAPGGVVTRGTMASGAVTGGTAAGGAVWGGGGRGGSGEIGGALTRAHPRAPLSPPAPRECGAGPGLRAPLGTLRAEPGERTGRDLDPPDRGSSAQPALAPGRGLGAQARVWAWSPDAGGNQWTFLTSMFLSLPSNPSLKKIKRKRI